MLSKKNVSLIILVIILSLLIVIFIFNNKNINNKLKEVIKNNEEIVFKNLEGLSIE